MAGGPAAPTGTARHATDGPTAGGCTLATSLNAAARRGPAGRGRPGPPSRSRKLRTSATPQPLHGPGPGVHSTGPAPIASLQSDPFRSRWTSLIGPSRCRSATVCDLRH